MPEDFLEIQDDIDRAQGAVDAMDMDSERYAEVILNDVDEFQAWIDGIELPDGMSQDEFDELTMPILVSLRDLLLSFDDKKNIDIYVETLSEELSMLRDEVEDLTLPLDDTSDDEGQAEAVRSPSPRVDLADTRPPGFAELMEDSDTEAVLAQYSMQEKLDILAEVSEGVDLTEKQMFRLENLNMIVTMLESLSSTLKKDGASKETEFIKYVLDEKIGEWASKIVENPDLTIEPIISGYGKDGVLLSRLLLDSGWYGGIESIDSEEELLDQKRRLVMWMRDNGDYEAARVVLEEALHEEFEEGRKKIEEERPKMREEAVRTVSVMLSTEEKGGENAGKSVYDIWNEEGIAQDTQDEFVKGLIDAETERLMNRKVAKEFLEDDMFDGRKGGLWGQYKEMIDPKGELLNFTDENAKMIMREVAINGFLILISGGIAAGVRAGVVKGLTVGARMFLGTARFTRIAESIGSMAKGGLMARRAYQGLKLSAGAAGLLVEGAAFDAAHMGLQGELFYKQPGWAQNILWTSATLGIFKGAGKLSAAVNGKIGSAVSKYAPKIADKSLVMGIQQLVVAGHIEFAGMLLSGALQKGYFAITEEQEFEWEWADEVLHAYVAVGALKINGGIIHSAKKSFPPKGGRKEAVPEREVEAPRSTPRKKTEVPESLRTRLEEGAGALEHLELSLLGKQMKYEDVDIFIREPEVAEAVFRELLLQKEGKINEAYDKAVSKKGGERVPETDLETRLAFVLGSASNKLTLREKISILSAHFVGIAEGRGIGTHTTADLTAKGRKLTEGGYDKDGRRILIEEVQLAGTEMNIETLRSIQREIGAESLASDHLEAALSRKITEEVSPEAAARIMDATTDSISGKPLNVVDKYWLYREVRILELYSAAWLESYLRASKGQPAERVAKLEQLHADNITRISGEIRTVRDLLGQEAVDALADKPMDIKLRMVAELGGDIAAKRFLTETGSQDLQAMSGQELGDLNMRAGEFRERLKKAPTIFPDFQAIRARVIDGINTLLTRIHEIATSLFAGGKRIQQGRDVPRSEIRRFQELVKRPDQSKVVQEIIEKEKFVVREVVEVGGQKFYMGPIIENTVDGYRHCIAFVEKPGGELKPRLFYKSHSDGVWRNSPIIMPTERGLKYWKGNHHYTQETRPHEGLVDYLDREEATGERYFSDTSRTYFEPSVKKPEILSEYTSEKKVSGYKTPALQEYSEIEPWNPKKPKIPKDEIGERLARLEMNKDFTMPDFKAELRRYPIQHTLLGRCLVRVYRGTLDGQNVEWHFANDVSGRVWIHAIRFENAETNSYGTDTVVIQSGVLTSKPIDYPDQVNGIEGKDYVPLQGRVGNKGDYVDQTPLLDNLTPIRAFRQATKTWRRGEALLRSGEGNGTVKNEVPEELRSVEALIPDTVEYLSDLVKQIKQFAQSDYYRKNPERIREVLPDINEVAEEVRLMMVEEMTGLEPNQRREVDIALENFYHTMNGQEIYKHYMRAIFSHFGIVTREELPPVSAPVDRLANYNIPNKVLDRRQIEAMYRAAGLIPESTAKHYKWTDPSGEMGENINSYNNDNYLRNVLVDLDSRGMPMERIMRAAEAVGIKLARR